MTYLGHELAREARGPAGDALHDDDGDEPEFDSGREVVSERMIDQPKPRAQPPAFVTPR